MNSLSRYRKSVIALLGFLGTWATTYFPDDLAVQKWLGLATGAVTAFLVYATPNTPPAGEPADPGMSEQDAGHVDAVFVIVGTCVVALGLVLGTLLLRAFA